MKLPAGNNQRQKNPIADAVCRAISSRARVRIPFQPWRSRCPDGTRISSDNPQINRQVVRASLGKGVTLWPLQPASNKSHYRRGAASARLVGPLAKIPGFRAVLPMLAKLPNLNAPLREIFSREPGEPIPDISTLPAEVLEFTSPPGTYFDAFPIHVLTTASLDAMSRHNPAAVWDVRRFRPNFLIKTEAGIAGLTESNWAGKTAAGECRTEM